MKRQPKLYSLTALQDYLKKVETVTDMEIIEGCLLDNYILWHGEDIIEIFEEVATTCWTSGYARHIYRKGLPKKWLAILEENEEY